MRFKVLNGKHVHDDGKRYKKGDILVSHHEMDRLFKNKFQRLADDQDLPPAEPVTVEKTGKKLKIKKKADETSDLGLGVDETGNFPLADEYGLKVYRKLSWYHVVDPHLGKAVNEKGLKKAAVDSFITSYVEE